MNVQTGEWTLSYPGWQVGKTAAPAIPRQGDPDDDEFLK